MVNHPNDAIVAIAALFSCLLILVAQPVWGDEGAVRGDALVRRIALGQLGYPTGLILDDDTVPRRYSLLFPLPKGGAVRSATLHLDYRATPPLPAGVELLVTINEQQVERVKLQADATTHTWQLALAEESLQAGQLKVEVEQRVPSDAQLCSGDNERRGRVRVMASSYLESHMDAVGTTLRDFWLTLPQEVRLSLPAGRLEESVFAAALEWVALLQRQHHQVRIVRLPEVGELVVAPAESIAALVDESESDMTLHAAMMRGEKRVVLLTRHGQSFMAVTEQAGSGVSFERSWRELNVRAMLPSSGSVSVAHTVPITALGIDTGRVQLGHRVEWHGTITPWQIPPGSRPETLNLRLQLPRVDERERLRLYIYLNERLALSRALSRAGGEERVELALSEQRPDNVYRLRMVVRSGLKEGCSVPTVHYPISIDSSSYLTVKSDTRGARYFSSFPTALGRGFDLLVPQQALVESNFYLLLASELLNGVVVAPNGYRIQFYDSGVAIKPTRDFLLLGRELPARMTVPLRLEQGRVELVDRQGSVVLANGQIRQLMILQVVRDGEHSGLWLYPGEQSGMPRIVMEQVGSSDIVFHTTRGKLFSVDTHQAGTQHIRYLDAPHWFESLHKARWWWLLAAWVVLTLMIYYLYIKSRQHRGV